MIFEIQYEDKTVVEVYELTTTYEVTAGSVRRVTPDGRRDLITYDAYQVEIKRHREDDGRQYRYAERRRRWPWKTALFVVLVVVLAALVLG